MKQRFFLDQDQSGHWYIVPAAQREHWNRWTELDEEDEKSWKAPTYARPVGGSPTMITFEDPK